MAGRKEKSASEKKYERELKQVFSERFKKACQKKFNTDKEIGTKELFEIYAYIYPDEAGLCLSKIDKNNAVNGLRQWLNGKTIPEYHVLIKLCNEECLNCTLDYLFGRIDCKTHDAQFIQEETGLSEKAIEELRNLALFDSAFASEPDLNTINILLEQLSFHCNNIIHTITGYLRSNGLFKDTWYDIRNQTLSERKPPMDTDRVYIPAHSDTFDNLLLMDIQKRIINLKNELKKTSDQ